MSAKKKPAYQLRKQKEEVNKKAIIWVASIIGALIIIMAVLLITQS